MVIYSRSGQSLQNLNLQSKYELGEKGVGDIVEVQECGLEKNTIILRTTRGLFFFEIIEGPNSRISKATLNENVININ